MYRFFLFVVVFCLIPLAPIYAQEDYTGVYFTQSDPPGLKLILQQDVCGRILGDLVCSNGDRFSIAGMVQEGVAVGACYEFKGDVYFEARPRGDELVFNLIEPGPDNMPDYSKVHRLVFVRMEGADGAQSQPDFKGHDKVADGER